MPSNLSPQPHQQLEDYLKSLKIALETNNFEAIERLVGQHTTIMNTLKEKIHQDKDTHRTSIQKFYDEVLSLVIKTKNLKEELGCRIKRIDKKKQQIEAYIKIQL